MSAEFTERNYSVLPGLYLRYAQTVNDIVYESTADELTAHAGGGQMNGSLILAKLNRFTVVANSGDSATLPPAVAGLSLVIRNDSGNNMNVFPFPGEAINSLGTNNAFSLTAGKESVLRCMSTGQWYGAVSN